MPPTPTSSPTLPVAVVDTREQHPWVFGPRLRVVRRPLASGDYSLVGLEDRVAVERKTLDDFVRSVTHERDRFFAEVARLSRFTFACVVVESDLAPLLDGRYRSGARPQALLATVATISVDYRVPVYFCGTRGCASALVEDLLVRLSKYSDAKHSDPQYPGKLATATTDAGEPQRQEQASGEPRTGHTPPRSRGEGSAQPS